MARRMKGSRIFGLASGKHRAERQGIRIGSGNVKHVFKCTLKEGTGIRIIKKHTAIANNSRIIKLLKLTIKKIFQVYRSVDGELQRVAINNVAATGYSIINFRVFTKTCIRDNGHAI